MSRRRRSRNPTAISDSHFVQMAEWLALEAEAEAERMAERIRSQRSSQAERSGESLLDLVIADHQSGIGGHHLLTLVKRNRQLNLPWHRLKAGSPILLSSYPDAGQDSLTGVVSARSPNSIQVAVDRWPEMNRFRVDLTSDEVTRQRQLAAITIAQTSRGRLGHLRRVMMGEEPPRFSEMPQVTFVTPLNESQRQAVAFALSADDLAIIHGPPGTGKTTTVVELILQAVQRGDRVLATAPSNTAVDNLLEKLISAGQQAVRLGHPARITGELQAFSLDGRVQQHENMAVIRELERESEQLLRQSHRYTRAKPARGAKQEMRRDAQRLKAEARRLERQAIEDVLDRAAIICATNTFNEDLVGDRWFDLLVIDEACQSTEPGSWVPLIRADRLVLAGDYQQLPPTILSRAAAEQGFSISLMERVHDLYGDSITRMLTVQYRMNREIMDFSSRHFYRDALIADASVVGHRLTDLAGVADNELTRTPVTFFDTAGAGWEEELEPDSESRLNRQEAALVIQLVQQLIEQGVAARDLAVITPYAAQSRLIRDLSPYPDLEVDTVDGFQGREKEAIVMTMVRSNPDGEVGFLSDTRRTNVALTRARRKLTVIGDSATLSNHEFYRELFDYFQEIGAYRSVWELPHSTS